MALPDDGAITSSPHTGMHNIPYIIWNIVQMRAICSHIHRTIYPWASPCTPRWIIEKLPLHVTSLYEIFLVLWLLGWGCATSGCFCGCAFANRTSSSTFSVSSSQWPLYLGLFRLCTSPRCRWSICSSCWCPFRGRFICEPIILFLEWPLQWLRRYGYPSLYQDHASHSHKRLHCNQPSEYVGTLMLVYARRPTRTSHLTRWNVCFNKFEWG